MPSYKLYYFDFGGRAEFIRVMFHYMGVPFEDVRFGFPEFGQKYKSQMPFGKVPVLEVDGVKIPESRAIGFYLAKKFGLDGKDDMEHAQMDALIGFFEDFVSSIQSWFSVALGFAPGDKDKLLAEVFEPSATKNMPTFEKYLKESGNGFYFKGGLTVVDFLLAGFWTDIDRLAPGFFKKYPLLKANADKVFGLPQIQKYLKERKLF